jgi:uncharacterized protein
MKFTWDRRKTHSNIRKHGVSFEEATTALHEPRSITGYDPDYSLEQERFVTFGMSNQKRLLIVSHEREYYPYYHMPLGDARGTENL